MNQEHIERQEKYINQLMEIWEDITLTGIALRKSFILGQPDKEACAAFIALIIKMWAELYPEAAGTSRQKKMDDYKEAYNNPTIFLEHPEEMFNLELLLRNVLADTGLTTLKGVK